MFTDLGSDLRYAVRQVKRSPGFAVLAVLCLGLGIGANTSIFSALNSVLFRPLSVADPARLLMLSRGTSANFSYPDFQDLQARGRLLSGLTASFPMESDLEVDGVSEFVAAEVVSANYGAVLGVAPALGRWFTSETEPVAVISHAVWQNRFGGSANVLGRRIGSEAQSYTIVGVAPRAFTGIFAPYRTDIWVPMRTRPRLAAMLDNRSRRLVMVFGRLRSDATPGQASAELNGIDSTTRRRARRVSGTAAADRGRTDTWNPESRWPAPRQPERIAAHDRRRRRSAHRVRERRQPPARARVPAPARAGRTTGTRRHEISPDASAADRKPRAGYRRRRERPRAGTLDDQNPRTCHALGAIDLSDRAGSVARRARHRVRDDPLARDDAGLRAGTRVAGIADQRSRRIQRGDWRARSGVGVPSGLSPRSCSRSCCS